jgi:hypothetical protein
MSAIQTDVVEARATSINWRNFKVGRNNIAPQGLAQLLVFSQNPRRNALWLLRPTSKITVPMRVSLTPKIAHVTTSV